WCRLVSSGVIEEADSIKLSIQSLEVISVALDKVPVESGVKVMWLPLVKNDGESQVSGVIPEERRLVVLAALSSRWGRGRVQSLHTCLLVLRGSTRGGEGGLKFGPHFCFFGLFELWFGLSFRPLFICLGLPFGLQLFYN
ncbi:hypothetical protein HID58_065823, partial [Brassica napus]